MDNAKLQDFVEKIWNVSIVPRLCDYIRIPNKSPFYDPQWRQNGHMDQAMSLVAQWCREQDVAGMKVEIVNHRDRTPLLFVDVPGTGADRVLLYGHLDKQPEMIGWRSGLDPWSPILEEDKLYGRGAADDGYAVFAALTAILALERQGIPHARCVILIEACEESGSYDLPYYIDALADRIGTPSLIVCLDSGCGNYDQLWVTTSLRGLAAGDLTVELLKEGVHSGEASGVAASSFRILRQLLSRLEDEKTGEILPREFHAEIPRRRLEEAEQTARILGSEIYSKLPFYEGVRPVADDPIELVLNRNWRPALAIVGAAGLPRLEDAGNVMRPMTAVRVSLRLPPGCDAQAAGGRLKALFETNPPYGARVRFEASQTASGWNAPELSPWLADSMNRASRHHFGRDVAFMGEGGSIPFMDMLGRKFPGAQFFITGVLGPNSNAHGPNEFLHLPTGKRLTGCISQVLADHSQRQ